MTDTTRRHDDRRESVWLRATTREDKRPASTPTRKVTTPAREQRQVRRK